ncbi:Zn-dependent alcohol dehydrogenase [Albimonas sp. CAU 1670]|uniref:Zn-dependent alcohol dehydrogenase n=1 Tax=Albimonas sp. CAU 1670 TaxID=3032599 RepID=UPI0023DAEBB7|nr:Zn-dependent alcohol dehydrogenase [Albimonas sp. CAU 1670]MDF2235124.1 Zn-dependent alcohol dehydrogenase [Albimonas sp. CAU 1670]
MKAAVLTEIGQELELLDLEQDGPGAGEIRVKVEAAGLCMSDWHVMIGDWPAALPLVLGHEAAGVVEEVGPDVTRVAKGDRVIFSFTPNCGHCPSCQSGVPARCNGHRSPVDATPAGRKPLKLNGEAVGQLSRIGTFAEYVVCSEEQAIRVPEAMPFGPAALIGCSVATGVGAVTRHAKVPAGATVAVIGCGGVGLNIVQGARLAGAKTIIAVDLLDAKLEMAKAFGATHTINGATEKVSAAVREIVRGPGVDFAFDALGAQATTEQAISIVGPGGQAVLVGIPAIKVQAGFSPFQLVFGEKKISGCFYGSVRPALDFPVLCDLYMQGKLDLDRLISKEITLDGINAGFADMRSGGVARSVIRF